MLICLDAAYTEKAAFGAGVLFDDWGAGPAQRIVHARLDGPAAYAPGAFYQRELPILLAILEQLSAQPGATPPDATLIDGYVWLDAHRLRGLGAHLYTKLHERTPVIGIAKTRFRGDGWSRQILRGQSKAPLYITAAGMDLDQAAANVLRMAGEHRIPDPLKLADREARSAAAAG